jgi:hypothetical protein
MTPADKLRKLDEVVALLATPEQWCQGVERTRDGRRCLVGAMFDAGAIAALRWPIKEAIQAETGDNRVAYFNDAATTTHADILRVLRRAREIVAAEQGGLRR